MFDLDLIYNVSLHKLHNFQTTRSESDGLRKLVLLNNFVCKKFVQEDPLEWSEEDIKKDEESWLDSCLDSLDEEEDGYVYINKPLEYQPTVAPFTMDCYDDPRHYEDYYIQGNNKERSHKQQFSEGIDDVIIPHDLLHLPFFDPFHIVIEEQDNNSNIRNSSASPQQVEAVNMANMTKVESFSECEKGFHPHWKDNSIIDHSIPPLTKSSACLDPNTRSFGIPKIFHKYRRRIDPPFNSSAILELLQPDYQSLEFSYESSLKRSKDDLDILTPRDLDQGVLMDMINMLEYYGGKTNHNNEKELNSSEINDIWFVDNDNNSSCNQ